MLKPTGDKALVREIKDEAGDKVSEGGVILPQTHHERGKGNRYEVVACGPGRKSEMAAHYLYSPAQVGDTVLLAEFAGTPVEIEGVEYKLVNPGEVLGVWS